MTKPRILLFDIEATNLNADFGFALCVGYKWYGEKRTHVPSLLDYPGAFGKDPTNDKQLMEHVHDTLLKADMIVGFYSKLFDLPWLEARMLSHGLAPLPSIPHVDLYFTAKTHLKIHSRRLANLIDFLGLKAEKTRLSGPIWIRAGAGHTPSIRYVVKHCRHDINALEQAYTLLRPLVRLHPNVTGRYKTKEKGKCRTCGSSNLQWRGRMLLTRTNAKRRVRCTDCGSWDTRVSKDGRLAPSRERGETR